MFPPVKPRFVFDTVSEHQLGRGGDVDVGDAELREPDLLLLEVLDRSRKLVALRRLITLNASFDLRVRWRQCTERHDAK